MTRVQSQILNTQIPEAAVLHCPSHSFPAPPGWCIQHFECKPEQMAEPQVSWGGKDP